MPMGGGRNMFEIEFLGVSAVTPSLLMMWYFHKRDVFPEPGKVLWATFGLGVLTVIPVLLVALPATFLVAALPAPGLRALGAAFLTAAIPEELFKYLVLILYAARHREFDEPMDGIVYGVAASLGFATLENVLYVADGGLYVALLRAVSAVPGHAFLGAIMGYFVGQARFATIGRHRLMALGLIVPILCHGLYDFPLFAAGFVEGDALGLWGVALIGVPAILIGEGVWTLRRVRELRADQEALVARRALGARATQSPLSPAPATQPATQAIESQRPVQPHSANRSGRSVAWLMLLGGGAAGSIGGLICLGVGLSFVTGAGVGADDAVDGLTLLLGTMIAGVAPMLLGLLSFGWGLRRLNVAG